MKLSIRFPAGVYTRLRSPLCRGAAVWWEPARPPSQQRTCRPALSVQPGSSHGEAKVLPLLIEQVAATWYFRHATAVPSHSWTP